MLSTDSAMQVLPSLQRRFLLQRQRLSYSDTNALTKVASPMTPRSTKSTLGHHAKQSQMSAHSLALQAPCAYGSRTSRPSLSPLSISHERTLTLFGRTSTTTLWRASSRQSYPPQHLFPSIINLDALSSLQLTHPSEELAGSSPSSAKMDSAAPRISDPLDGMNVRVATHNLRLNSMACFERYVLSECILLVLLISWLS